MIERIGARLAVPQVAGQLPVATAAGTAHLEAEYADVRKEIFDTKGSALMSLQKVVRRGAIVLTATTLTSVGIFVGNASALDSTSCSVKYDFGGPTSCWTGTIRSNGNYHRIYYKMCAAPGHYADWQIKDADNGVIVAQGRVQNAVCTERYVNGLYGAYHGWVFNTRKSASAYIDNR